MIKNSSSSAFTLLEIALVLIVIGLIAAGVTVGRSISENASLQSVVADFDMYRQAALAYREKYQELPGDHSNATSLSSADAGCPNPPASDVFTTATCNGDGNGIIGDTAGNPMGSFARYNELLLVWQHLANAGFIKGNYNGRRSAAPISATPGVNVPLEKIGSATFVLRNFPTNTVTTGYFKANYGHVFFFGEPGDFVASPFNNPALTTEQAKAIDLKIDDGKPGLGKVLTTPFSVQPCPTNAGETDAVYDGSLTDAACALIFITGF